MSKLRILIVEDEGVVAKDIKSSLRRLGYIVPAMVLSGEQAIKEVEKIRPDLVLMDIRLDGGMDGIQTAEVIRDRFHIPVVYLTAYTDKATLERAKMSEPFGYIVKPFEENELEATVEMAFYKHCMERKLQESEERFRGIFENAVIGLYRTTPDGQILMANPALVRMLGYHSFEELSKRGLEKEGYEPSYPRSAFKELIESEGEVMGLEAAWVRLDGTALYIRESARAVRDEAGNIIYYEGTVEDITERRKTEEALRESEERYRTLVETQEEAVCRWLPDTTLTFVNEGCCRFFRRRREELLGTKWLMLVPEESRSEVQRSREELAEGSKVYRREHHVIGADGRKLWQEWLDSPIFDTQGKLIEFQSVGRDITERKRAEAWLNKRLLYEQVLSYCSQALLEIDNLDHAIISIAEEILPVMDASYVRIFQNFEDPVNGTYMRLLHEAVAGEVESRLNDPLLKYLPYNKFSECVLDTKIHALVKEEQKVHESEKVRSILNVPIRVGNRLWGLISLRDCVRERVWEEEDIQFLNTVASMVKTAIERKRVEEALRESEERLRATLDALPDLLFEVDPEGRIYDFRAPRPEMLYIPPQKFLGRKVSEVIPEKASSVIMDAIAQAAERGTYTGAIYSLEMPTGTRWFELSIASKRDPNTPKGRLIVTARDITERKQVEEELIRLSNAMRMTTDGVVVGDLEAKIIYVNEATLEMYGTDDKKDLIGKNSFDLIAPEERERALLYAKETLEKGYCKNLEYHVITKDGSRIPVEMSTSLMKDAEGRPIGFVSVSRDITERKKAENALREAYKAREELEQIVNQSEAIIFLWRNAEGWPVEFVSDNIRHYGYSPEEWYSGEVKFADIVHSDDLARVTDEVKRCSEEGRTEFTQLYRIVTKKGDVRWVDDRTLVRRDTEGKITHYQGIVLDITERKKAEEKIRYHANLVANVSDAITSTDLDFTIRSWNNAAERIFGWKAEEVIGKKMAGITSMEYLSKPTNGVETELFERGYWEGEIIQRRKDGKPLNIYTSVSLIRDSEGKPVGIVSIDRDVTERKKAEEKERQYIRTLSFLSKTATDFVTLSAQDDIYRYIGERLKELVGDAFIGVTSFDEASNKMVIRSMLGLSKDIEAIIGILGQKPEGLSYPIPEEGKRHLLRGELQGFKFDVEEMTKWEISRSVTIAVKKSFGFEKFYSVGFARGGELMGSAIIVPLRGNFLENKDAIKAFINQATVALQRKRAEEALRESEERYRVFTEEALVGIYICRDRKYLFVNQAMEEITGYSKDELLNMIPHELSLPGDRNSLDKRVREQKLKASSEYTVDIRRKNGEAAVIEVKVRSIPYGEGVAYLGNCIDITERVRQREQIELARKEWERTFDSIPDLLMILDPDRRILRANQAVVEYTGLGFKELSGRSYLDVFHQNNKKNMHSGDTPREVAEFFEITDPETNRIFSVSVSPLFDSRDKMLATVNVARDVTQMHEFEQALMESELQFRGLAESAQDIIFSIDADGSILYLNPVFKEITGYNPAEFVGVNVQDFFDSLRSNAEVKDNLMKYLAEPGGDDSIPLFEIEILDAKGHKHVLEISARFLSGQLIGIARDVTERKRMEQQLLRASKFASIGVLAAGLGHQVNNPLASILATSTALKEMFMNAEEMPEDLRKKTTGYLTAMEQQLDRTHQVVSSLLEFAKDKQIDVMFYDVNNIVREALQFLSQHLSFKDISLELLLDETLPSVSIDREALQQVIVNVVQNAYEAMEGSGNLVIRTAKERKGVVSLFISNDGPPIPMSVREEMFELLFTTKTTQKGTGLGLPISAMLLGHFGGRLYLEESKDKETRFVIEVPIHTRREK